MDIIQQLLSNVPLPRMVRIRQQFSSGARIEDISAEIKHQIANPRVGDRVKPGMRIAVTVGSRGIADIDKVARSIVDELKRRGAKPFIVPAMGSHGGSTAEGQIKVLANLRVTEENIGCPIISSMNVVELARLDNGLPVLIDKEAYEADGIVVLNRVKPHSAFRGPSESGLVKMIAIGLGKQKGADTCHVYGFGHMAQHIVQMAHIAITKAPIIFGIAIIENAYDQVMKLVGVPASDIIEADRKLLHEARANMARIPFQKIDVLIVDWMGKEFSGSGMDPNITGRYATPFASGGPEVNKLVVLDLTKATQGNATGVGMADFTTRRLVNKINYQYTYANAFTATITIPVKIPVIMESDRDAILGAIKTCNATELNRARIVRVNDTLHLDDMYVSESLLDVPTEGMFVSATPNDIKFDLGGNVLDAFDSSLHH
jgi:hypothetical protein